jgi:hypothetical protein
MVVVKRAMLIKIKIEARAGEIKVSEEKVQRGRLGMRG